MTERGRLEITERQLRNDSQGWKEIYVRREINDSNTQRPNKYAEPDFSREEELSEDGIAQGSPGIKRDTADDAVRCSRGKKSVAGRFKE